MGHLAVDARVNPPQLLEELDLQGNRHALKINRKYPVDISSLGTLALFFFQA